MTENVPKITCVVPGCLAYLEDGIRMHRFPTKFWREIWLTLINPSSKARENRTLYACSSHFTEASYVQDTRDPNVKHLKVNACPTLNLDPLMEGSSRNVFGTLSDIETPAKMNLSIESRPPSTLKVSIFQMCRVCLTNDAVTYNIFSNFKQGEGTPKKISEIIMICSNTKILETDKFPNQICELCVSDLYKAYSFKSKCEKSDKMLTDYVKQYINGICEVETTSNVNENKFTSDELKEKIRQNILNYIKFKVPGTQNKYKENILSENVIDLTDELDNRNQEQTKSINSVLTFDHGNTIKDNLKNNNKKAEYHNKRKLPEIINKESQGSNVSERFDTSDNAMLAQRLDEKNHSIPKKRRISNAEASSENVLSKASTIQECSNDKQNSKSVTSFTNDDTCKALAGPSTSKPANCENVNTISDNLKKNSLQSKKFSNIGINYIEGVAPDLSKENAVPLQIQELDEFCVEKQSIRTPENIRESVIRKNNAQSNSEHMEKLSDLPPLVQLNGGMLQKALKRKLPSKPSCNKKSKNNYSIDLTYQNTNRCKQRLIDTNYINATPTPGSMSTSMPMEPHTYKLTTAPIESQSSIINNHMQNGGSIQQQPIDNQQLHTNSTIEMLSYNESTTDNLTGLPQTHNLQYAIPYVVMPPYNIPVVPQYNSNSIFLITQDASHGNNISTTQCGAISNTNNGDSNVVSNLRASSMNEVPSANTLTYCKRNNIFVVNKQNKNNVYSGNPNLNNNPIASSTNVCNSNQSMYYMYNHVQDTSNSNIGTIKVKNIKDMI